MDWKNIFSGNLLRSAFSWTPIAVGAPTVKYFNYGTETRMIGYSVDVEYLRQGKKTYYFGIDSEKFGIMPPVRAHNRAMRFYNKIKQQIAQTKVR